MTVSAGDKRLKVLFFSQRFPFPMDAGGKIRTGKILEKLKDCFDITLVSNVESPHDDDYLNEVKKLCAEFYPVPWKEVRKYSFRFYLKLLLGMFSRYPFTVVNDCSRDLKTALRNLMSSKRFDLLVCDFLQPSLNVRKINGIAKLLFEHNIESVIPRRHFETSRNPIAKIFWWLQWRRMERYEMETCQRFSGTVTVSEIDKQYLEKFGITNVFAIPTGVDTDYFAPRECLAEVNSVVFIGSMDWLPNEDAILYFAREILAKIKTKVSNVTVTVVGKNPSRRLLAELKGYPEIKAVGRVSDVRPYISSHTLYIVPLRIGGGTRIKIYEAMAMGKAVISTSIGSEGLPLTDGENVVIADTPDRFSDAVIELLSVPEKRIKMEVAALDFVRQNCSWDTVATTFANICWTVFQKGLADGETAVGS